MGNPSPTQALATRNLQPTRNSQELAPVFAKLLNFSVEELRDIAGNGWCQICMATAYCVPMSIDWEEVIENYGDGRRSLWDGAIDESLEDS